MKLNTKPIRWNTDSFDDLPVSPTIKVLRPNKYGSIPDLPDEELADPEELERVAELEQWAPLLKAGLGRPHNWQETAWEYGVDW